MKALKIIGIIIGILIVVVVILMFIAPTTMNSEVSTVINAPKNVVYSQVSNLRHVDQWSPWRDYDENMTVTFEGEDGALGSKMSWEGNEDVGKGWQKIILLEDDRIEKEVHFLEPWESEAKDYVVLEEVEGGTKVTWGFIGEMPRPWNVMGLFMNMEDAVEKDFSKGLEKLKARSEEAATKTIAMAQTPKYDIQEIDMPARVYIMKRETITWDQISDFFSAHLGTLYNLTQKNQMEMAGAPSGIYFMWDEENKKADMAAAIPVKAVKGEIKPYSTFTAPAGKYMVIDYYGSYSGSGEAHYALDNYIEKNGYQPSTVVIEEYITDPGEQHDTSKWLTKIYYNVVK